MSHSYHPPIEEHGLADGCERCAEHARDPFISLDNTNLSLLVVRTMAWMQDKKFPRSENEAAAMREVEYVVVRARRLRHLGYLNHM
jgi:hypothetical protein